jgi:hypothetical protein
MDKVGSAIPVVECTGTATVWKQIPYPNRKIKDLNGIYESIYRARANLRMRVKQGLVNGKLPHPVGRKIRENEDLSEVFVRWATTDRPSCVEEELHNRYRLKFGRLPKYALHT